MRTIYLDHNIIHYFVRGFPGLREAEDGALQRALRSAPELRFAVSDWNLIEPCWEIDKSRDKMELVDRYASFLDALNPLFITNVTEIKRDEMAQLVYGRLGLETAPVHALNQTYSQARAVYGAADLLLGYTPRHFMRHLARTPEDLSKYRSGQQAVLDAQLSIQRAKQTGEYDDPAYRPQVLRAWFESLIPDRGPDGKFIRPQAAPVVDGLVNEPDVVYSSCPAIRAESLLSDARANTGGRNPQLTDAIDLMHSVPVLGYCDGFVSNDGFVRECARQVIKKTGRALVIDRSLSDVIAALDPPPVEGSPGQSH
jgi:hypothetical protein